MLETRNIFLDTQTFVQNNYFKSPRLNELFDLAAAGHINLFLTEITINEIKSNIKEDLQRSSSEINKFNKAINNNGKIIKNLSYGENYTKLPAFDIEEAFKDLLSQLEEIIKTSRVLIIDYLAVELKEIFSKYFKHEQPFGIGKKKSEFPDAFVISAVEGWCQKEKQSMYFISGDKDFDDFSFKNIIIEKSLSSLLDKINKQLHSDKYDLISKIYYNNQAQIAQKIKDAFIFKIKDEIGFDISIENTLITHFEITNYQVEDMSDSLETTLQITGEIEYSLDVTYEDCSYAIYDKEDDRYYGCESNTVTLEQEQTFHAQIVIEADLDDKEAEHNFEIICKSVDAPDESDIAEQLDGYVFQF
ncbi:PIN domain-containing protein [Mucilaginibacter sp. 3215]|uniref:PIN domain-containing protein n=1 Tax=Mucilaginibacter sp. 3215 TaxID=3373912 RepID=UPI003D1AFB68